MKSTRVTRLGGRIVALGVLVGAILTVHAASAEQPPEMRLRDVTIFAFGPITVAGIESSGETALRAVLEREHAAELLEAAFADATPEGMAFALVGLRKVGPDAYARCVALFRKAPPERVRTMQGCLVALVSGRDLLRVIEAGRFDAEVAKARGGKEPGVGENKGG